MFVFAAAYSDVAPTLQEWISLQRHGFLQFCLGYNETKAEIEEDNLRPTLLPPPTQLKLYWSDGRKPKLAWQE